MLDRPVERITRAADASFYRLIPRAVVLPSSVGEVRALFRLSHEALIPMTFRAAGTSLSGQAAWYHYDGQNRFTALPRQNDYLGELGFYVGELKLEPFVQYHKIDFSDAVNTNNGQERYQGGLTYFIYGHNFKFTGAFTRLVPKNPSLPCTNEITVQLQAYYF